MNWRHANEDLEVVLDVDLLRLELAAASVSVRAQLGRLPFRQLASLGVPLMSQEHETARMNPFSGILQPEIPEGFKRCTCCHRVKRTDLFHSAGRGKQCKACINEKVQLRAIARREADPVLQPERKPRERQTEAERKAKQRARYQKNRATILTKANERYHAKTKHDLVAKEYQRKYHADRRAHLNELRRLRKHATVKIEDSSVYTTKPDWSWLKPERKL
jgi:hypothetical protein